MKTVSASISHQFAVSDIGDTGVFKSLFSPVVEVEHNNFKLEFKLNLCINNSFTAVNVCYVGGPKDSIEMEYELFVVSDNGRISIKEPVTREFKRGVCGRRGNQQAMPATANQIEEMGYLTSAGQILHVLAELSINESAFPLKIFTSLSHKFSMDAFVAPDPDSSHIKKDEPPPSSPVMSVAHNSVKLGFKFCSLSKLSPVFSLQYVDGPMNVIVMDVEVFVIKGRKRQSIMRKSNYTIGRNVGPPLLQLPQTIDALSAAGYLGLDRKSIQLIAELFIPENAFQAAAIERRPPLVVIDSLGFYLFQEVTTPAATDSPTSNRVEFISNKEEEDDKTHLWAHKDVLSFASDVFKDLFDPTKPEEAKMESLKRGVMQMDDLSGDALKQMMHFIYLRQTDKDFGNFTQEILPVADRFLIKGLKEECERSLIDQLNTMDIEDLICCFKSSRTFILKKLEAACVQVLPLYMQQNNEIEVPVVESLIKLAEEHNHGSVKSACELNLVCKLGAVDDRCSFVPLLSIARQHELGVLTDHCLQWFKSNFTQLKEVGFIEGLEADNSENGRNVIHFLLENMTVLP